MLEFREVLTPKRKATQSSIKSTDTVLVEVTLVKLIEQKQANQFFTIFTNLFEFFKANEASRPMNLLYVCTRYLITVYVIKWNINVILGVNIISLFACVFQSALSMSPFGIRLSHWPPFQLLGVQLLSVSKFRWHLSIMNNLPRIFLILYNLFKSRPLFKYFVIVLNSTRAAWKIMVSTVCGSVPSLSGKVSVYLLVGKNLLSLILHMKVNQNVL